MKVLVIGSGGREHALCWKIKQSPKVGKLYCAPGNAGTAELAQNVDIAPEDIEKLLEFALREKIDLTVVGPEGPLALGIVDEFEKKGLKVFGPNSGAAMMEGSKAFAKQIMVDANVPTARFEVICGIDEAQAVSCDFAKGAAVKADGLCQGKGVIICKNQTEIMGAINKLVQDQIFASAAKRIVIEELLEGEEASILAFCDGRDVKLMVAAQDHKRVFDDDNGPNTGGMGAYAPAPVARGLEEKILNGVFIPVMKELNRRKIEYKGVLYAGLMIRPDGKFDVLEFNARFGDPETQVILPLLESDLVDIMVACIEGRLDKMDLKWKDGAACSVVLAAGGYPEKYEKGKEITGLENISAFKDVFVFHAGTRVANGKIVTNGGRVLNVVGRGKNIEAAIANAYTGVSQVDFDGAHFRTDIGKKALKK